MFIFKDVYSIVYTDPTHSQTVEVWQVQQSKAKIIFLKSIKYKSKPLTVHGGQHGGRPLGGSGGGSLPAFHPSPHPPHSLNWMLPGGYKVGSVILINICIIIRVLWRSARNIHSLTGCAGTSSSGGARIRCHTFKHIRGQYCHQEKCNCHQKLKERS